MIDQARKLELMWEHNDATINSFPSMTYQQGFEQALQAIECDDEEELKEILALK